MFKVEIELANNLMYKPSYAFLKMNLQYILKYESYSYYGTTIREMLCRYTSPSIEFKNTIELFVLIKIKLLRH